MTGVGPVTTPANCPPARGPSSVCPSCLLVSQHQPHLSPNHSLGHTGPGTPVPSSSWLVGGSDGDLKQVPHVDRPCAQLFSPYWKRPPLRDLFILTSPTTDWGCSYHFHFGAEGGGN